MISDLGNGHVRKRRIIRSSKFEVRSSKGRQPIQDEFTGRSDLTAQQKYQLRHPYKGSGGNGIHGVGALNEKSARLNLGLALLSMVAIPGVPLTVEDIAAWCDCSHQAIVRIERVALKKLRNALFFRDHAACAELREAFTNARQPAMRRHVV